MFVTTVCVLFLIKAPLLGLAKSIIAYLVVLCNFLEPSRNTSATLGSKKADETYILTPRSLSLRGLSLPSGPCPKAETMTLQQPSEFRKFIHRLISDQNCSPTAPT